MTRFVRAQLILFTLATVIGLVVLALVYLRIPSYLGIDEYTITAEFSDAARLYEGAEVTVRGDPVGRVTDLRLIQGGIEVAMDLDSNAAIPTPVRAEIHSRSAVGVQYVTLVPQRTGGPVLTDGDVIPIGRTSVPVQIGPLLEQTNALLASLPTRALNTVVNETYTALRHLGPDLQRLLDNTERLVTAANRNYAPTERLLDDLGPLLETQTTTSPQIRALTADLAAVTQTLRASDPDLRALLHDGQPFAHQFTGLLRDIQPTLPMLLGHTLTTGRLLATYNAGLEQALSIAPAAVAILQAATFPYRDRDFAAIDLNVSVNNPPPCIAGFLPSSKRRPPADLSPRQTPRVYCSLPQTTENVVRGARNSPCPQAPGRRTPTVQQCHGGFDPQATANPPFPPSSPAPDLRRPTPTATETTNTLQDLLLAPGQ